MENLKCRKFHNTSHTYHTGVCCSMRIKIAYLTFSTSIKFKGLGRGFKSMGGTISFIYFIWIRTIKQTTEYDSITYTMRMKKKHNFERHLLHTTLNVHEIRYSLTKTSVKTIKYALS